MTEHKTSGADDSAAGPITEWTPVVRGGLVACAVCDETWSNHTMSGECRKGPARSAAETRAMLRRAVYGLDR